MITLVVNKKKHNLDASPDMPLLWALRDTLGLTGTKYGCGVGACGACKILVNDEVTYSCLTPVSAAVGKEITTVEGATPNLQLLQIAWIEFNVPQCGFCQPGQLIAATSLLNSNSNPTDEEIDDAMSGNICRCGTYQRIKKAIHHTVELKKQQK
ncbi:isoquinoline 1-oxidoreductase, alpha subunit [Flavobacterium gillisiae]|uniref:Isoquinoline 1-oxidoreductase, alpha subunit n=1 Tax=Flavobacterium gillisiae TaxID=150146 RepID=A0A1H4BV61_9FLAO|nr:(2Fe-2S)-binding protein [Flavobacterium gillisiae]SEA51957.1 isoquinoline 1-oxidoreductase, alpha subunit [Flavobacterium gillisiae]